MSNLLNIKDQNGNWIPIPIATNGITSIVQNSDYTLTIILEDGTVYTTTSIRGEKGEKGDRGIQGIQGEKGDSFTYADFTPEQLASLKGAKGDKGDKGDAGEKGERGDKGDTGAQGSQGEKGDKGDKGDDYVLTEQDKVDIANLIQKPWELIEDFTLEEDSGFDKSTEPDGTPYNFRSAYVRITVPPNSTSIASGYGRWYFVDENNTMLTAESGKYTANTAQMCKTILIERNANMALANLNVYTSTGGRGMLGYKNLSGISFNYGNIKHIYTNAQDKEPAGARIEIYAQRA